MTDLFTFALIERRPVASIVIPPDRQRAAAKADDALLVSIQVNGLLNPIIIREDNTLVAGERRLDAFRQLNLPEIPVRVFEKLTPLAAHMVELQENLARKSLTWQEETKAIADFHAMRVAGFPGWTMHGTGSDLGLSQSSVSRYLAVAKFLLDEDVRTAATLTGAFNLIEARADRQIAAATARGLIVGAATGQVLSANATKEEKSEALLADLADPINRVVADTSDILTKLERSEEAGKALAAVSAIDRQLSNDDRIQQADFHEWAYSYAGPKFDVLHCDFPYGKNYKGSNTRKTGRSTTTPLYADSSDIYFSLVDTLLATQDSYLLPQAHCIFWMDMIHYQWTIEQFTAAGWTLVQPFPLIWTKNYQGVAADTKRRPRHCYETALFFSRGDRTLRKLDKDHYEERVDEKLHTSQKPIGMLKHFLSLVVDEHTAVLDPTAGSGTAIVAASKLGASRVLGLELDPGNADVARFILKRELG